MNIERAWWFRAVVLALTLATAWWLTRLVGLWPNGPRSIPSALMLLVCVMGLERLYATGLGLIAVAVVPGKSRVREAR
jgi:hypothetical protein